MANLIVAQLLYLDSVDPTKVSCSIIEMMFVYFINSLVENKRLCL